MFLNYLLDMKSWIFFLVLSLLLADLLLWLDPGLDVRLSSLVYMNSLLLIVFTIFIIWRYRKETAYIRQLSSLEEEAVPGWYEALPKTTFVRDKQVNEIIQTAGISFSKQLNEIRQTNIVHGDYTAAWVHEAKTPLTAMKLLIDSGHSDSVMRRIEAEWLRLNLLIDQQLYISRLPTLESDFLLEETQLKKIVIEEIKELMSWCREKNIAIETHDLDQLVITDKKWSRFILRQILSNAVKYSPQGANIEIFAYRSETGHVLLSISDKGPGIEVHELPRIFDKGFTGGTGRLHNAATGLGLYLAKTVADKIGIQLTVIAGEEQGTTVEMAFSHENDFDAVRK